jgi:hypothetical protein
MMLSGLCFPACRRTGLRDKFQWKEFSLEQGSTLQYFL